MKQGLIFIWVAALLVTFGQSGCVAQKQDDDSRNNKMAADFKLKTTDGKDISLKDLKGKVIILDIWDTWCPPCRMEIPHFIDLYSKYNQKGVVILGVAIGREGGDAVKSFIRKNKINYLGAFASDKFLEDYGPITGIPTTFVIDRKGKIVRTYVGYRDKSVFEADIKEFK